MNARDIMTPDPTVVLPSDSIAMAAQTMRSRSVGMLPVVDAAATMRLVGVITDRDITTRCVAELHGPTCLVAAHMTTVRLQTVFPEDTIDAVARKMEFARVRRVPVVEPGNRLIGVIAQADLARKTKPRDWKLVEEVLAAISAPAVPG